MSPDQFTTTTPNSALLNLPTEVLAHICAYLVPSKHTFLLKACARDSSSDAAIPPGTRGHHLLPEDELHPEYPFNVFKNCMIDIFALLLLHSTIHPLVVKCLYSTNIFYAPDLATLLAFRQSLSLSAVSNIRTIRVDACGPAARFFRGYSRFYGWTQLADIEIVGIPELFPGLRELRLGGVGPGVVHRRAFTYRGSRCVRDIETNDIWTVDNIQLISKIVGIHGTGEEGAQVEENAAANRHVLSSGRIFCMRYDESETQFLPRGSHRLYGTRIVRRGEIARPGLREQEVEDVTAAMARAIEVREEYKSLGLSEVSVHDVM